MIALRQLRPYTGDHVAPSPNHGARRAAAIQGIVLHATEDSGDEAEALAWLCSPRSRASCHLLVSRAGEVTRLVGDRDRAWHAGDASWRGTRDVNSCTLGIEIANRNDGEPFTDAQYGRVAEIVAHYCRQGVPLANVVGHGDIAAPRKTDPRGWDWVRFRRMVEAQLHATPADIDSGDDGAGPRPRAYDRRSATRQAADQAAAAAAKEAPPPAPGDASVRAHAGNGPFVERRMAPRSGDRRVAPPAARPRARPNGTAKPILRSRTIWLNGLTVLAAGSVMVGEILDLAVSVGLTVPERITMWALFFIGIVNIILRFRTTGPIGKGGGDRVLAEATVQVSGRTAYRGMEGVAAGQW